MSLTQSVVPRRVKSVCVPSASNPSCAQQQAQMSAVTMLAANAQASMKYDPPPTPPSNPAKFVETFRNSMDLDLSWSSLFVAGAVCIVYGIIHK